MLLRLHIGMASQHLSTFGAYAGITQAAKARPLLESGGPGPSLQETAEALYLPGVSFCDA